jgi:autotransporter translocation and assembly factor TamB
VAETPPGPASRTELKLEVSHLAPFASLLGVSPEAKLDGRLEVSASLRAPAETASWEGEGTVSAFSATLGGRGLSLSRPVPFRIEKGKLAFEKAEIAETSVPGGGHSLTPSTATLSGSVGVEAPYPLDLAATANLDAALLAPFAGDASLSGRLLIDARAAGTPSRLEPSGRVVLESIDYRPAGGGAPIEGITGALTVANGRLTTRDLTMRYSGGAVSVSATATLEGLSMASLRAAMHLAGVRLEPFAGFSATISGDLRVEGDPALHTARGEIVVDRAVYDADVGISLAAFLSGKRNVTVVSAVGPFDAMALDVRLSIPPSAIAVRNNVAHVDLSGDLVFRGNYGRPVLYGQLEAEEGGRLKLRDLSYELVSGKIIFSNPSRIEPFFDVDARTSVRTSQGDYRVRVVLTGTPARLAARFSSDPQLTEAQIVSLLVSGTLPASAVPGAPVGGTTSSDASVTQAARDLLTGLASEALTGRTKQFFRLDRLQIDPNFQGTSFTGPRVTIGKTFGRNVTATIAYQFGSASNAQQQVITLEYQISPTAFLQAVQDEYGVYSLELKLRQQLR